MYNSDAFDGDIDIPIYGITPEAIFKGKVPLFDVNFFDPNQETIDYSWMTGYAEEWEEYASGKSLDDDKEKINDELKKKNKDLSIDKIQEGNKIDEKRDVGTEAEGGISTYTSTYDKAGDGTYKIVQKIDGLGQPISVKVLYSPPPSTTTSSTSNGENNSSEGLHSLSYELQNTVANWYYRILMIAIVGMMSVLVYMGIRILLSSTASDKAKYKQMLGDWVIGMVILFMMHYGMVFANKMADKITDMLNNINPHFYIQAIEDTSDGKIEKALKESGFNVDEGDSSSAGLTDNTVIKDTVEVPKQGGGTETKNYLYFSTNLMGKLRYDVQANKSNSSAYIGYTVLFAVMVIYLFIFTFTYMKRVVYMAFLTIIAPLVALTYPIDKVNDGQAQGFNYWFKEYVFNLLLQPMHLLLYTILISSAISLATENMIYALVAMGFMVPAEKILRQMFNFGKANTPGVFGGAAGAAMVMGGLKWIAGRGPKGGGSKGGGSSSGGGSSDSSSGISSGKIGTERYKMSGVPGDDGFSIGAGKKDKGGNPANKKFDTPGNLYKDNKTNLNRNLGKSNIPDLYRDRARKSLKRMAGYKIRGAKTGMKNTLNNMKNSEAMKRLRVGSYMYKDGVKHNFKRRLAEGRPIKTLARFSVGAPIMAAGALVGTAAGVASGDAGNAVKYGAGAGVALSGMRKYADVIGNRFTIDGIQDEMDRAAYGNEEYERRRAEEKQKEMAEDQNNIATYAEELKVTRDRREADKRNEEMISFFADNDIKTHSDMIKAEKVAKKMYSDEYNSDSKETRNEARAKAAYGRQLKKEFVGADELDYDNEKRNEIKDKIRRVKKLDDGQAEAAMRLLDNWIDGTR